MTDEKEVFLGGYFNELLQERECIIYQMQALEKQKNAIDACIQRELEKEEAVYGVTKNFKISWKTLSSQRFDTSFFKQEHPRMYELYTKECVGKKYLVKRISVA